MNRLLFTAAAAAVALVANTPAPAQAGEQQGVKCPQGFEAHISNGNRRLVCSREKTYELASICSPIVVGNQSVNLKQQVVMDPKGDDHCLAVVTGQRTRAVASPPLPGYPALSAFRHVSNNHGPDKYVATAQEYAFPQGALPYVGDASKGVTCPSGYDGDSRYEGRGIRCDKNDGPRRGADCDGVHVDIISLGWRLEVDHKGQEDRCLKSAVGDDSATKPSGVLYPVFQAERALDNVGWWLDKRNGGDQWQRKVYAYPRSQ